MTSQPNLHGKSGGVGAEDVVLKEGYRLFISECNSLITNPILLGGGGVVTIILNTHIL